MLGVIFIFFLLMGFLVGFFCSSMAHVRKTLKPIDILDVADSTLDVVVSFKFGLLRVTSSDLDEFAKAIWLEGHGPKKARVMMMSGPSLEPHEGCRSP